MKQTLTAFLFCLSAFAAAAQTALENSTAEIVQEGKRLYRSEMASWYGTDIFLERFPALKEKFNGYFSYTDGPFSRCLFFSKGDAPRIIATITFDSTYDLTTALADGSERDFSALERGYYELREKALTQIQGDTLFRQYKNTNFNFVPLREGDTGKVYVLTGPSQSGVVMFGNDYLLTYDAAGRLIGKRRLHKSLIPMNYGNQKKEAGGEPFVAMHTHLPESGELMTATDVCTLLLYQKLTGWKQHIVISENYVSIWDGNRQSLMAITKEAWNKIYGK